MGTIKIDPFATFESLAKTISEAAQEFEKGLHTEKNEFNPRADIYEDENNVYISLEAAGINKEDVSVRLSEEKILVVKGEKKRNTLAQERKVVRGERLFGEFSRNFALPESADTNSISAQFKNGVLDITIAKKAPEQAKEIYVEIN